MIVKTIHSLEKVFFDRSPEPAEWSADVAARGEVYSFQVMLEPETMSERGVCRVAVQSELPVEVRLVQNVPVRQAVNFNPDDDPTCSRSLTKTVFSFSTGGRRCG